MTDALDNAGTLSRLPSGEVELRFERRLDHPLEKVWAAISIPERIGDWFCEMSFAPTAGAPIDQTFHHAGGLKGTGEVLRFEPPHLFEWRWHGNGKDEHDSVVSWRLEPDGEGTRIILTHRTPDAAQAKNYGHGWHVHLDGLEKALVGGRFEYPPPNNDAVTAHYEAAFA